VFCPTTSSRSLTMSKISSAMRNKIIFGKSFNREPREIREQISK
jgi:hypothetical protein